MNPIENKKYILIVDDDPLLAELYEKKIRQGGFETDTANDGEEALKKIRTRKPDLVILDIMMPKKNGVETIKELRNDPATKDIPIIVNSNMSDDPKDVDAVKSLGAIDCLVKANTPVNQLCQTIKDFLERNQITGR